MAVPSPATSTTVSSKHITQSIFKHMIVCKYVCMQREHEVFWGLTEILQCFPISKHSNLSSNISKCSGLCLDLPLSMKAVRVSQGHRLSHCYFRASAINTQQVLPCLLWDLTVVCTWRGETHIKRKRVSTICFSHFHLHILHSQRWGLPCLSCMCPPFITPTLLLSMGPGGSEKTKYRKYFFLRYKGDLNALLC